MNKTLKKLLEYKQFKIILALIFSFIVILIAISLYYGNKFYPNTTINGIDVSNQTYDEAIDTVEQYLKGYEAKIIGRQDGQMSLKGSDIQLTYDYKDALKQSLESIHDGISFYRLFTNDNLNVDFHISYDENKFKSILKSSSFIKATKEYKIQKPVNAHVEYDEKTKLGKIVKEVQGNALNIDTFYDYTAQEVKKISTNITLDDGNVYLKPKYTTEDKEVKDQLSTYNMYLLKWISWDMGENVVETMTPDDIKAWLSIDDNAKVKVNKTKMAEWVEAFCLKYKTVGKTRDFKTHSGKVIKLSGGDYGWQLDYDKTVEQAYNAITKTIDSQYIEAYKKEKNDANQKKLTINLDPLYKNTAYKKDYTDFKNDWDTQNYSEVDLSEQKVYVYKNGKQVFSCKCVTGLPSDPTRATKTGVWYIKDKKLQYTLTGDDYSTPTRYWIRITWTGTGYHYMNRSDWSRWSPSLYKSRGSHGCINLQLNDVRTIYGLVKLRDVVFIHY